MLTLRPNSLNWALEHALQYGDTDVFPLPFEYDALRHDWQTVRGWLEKQDLLQWQVRPHRTLLSPKARHGFRVITQLDPLDFLVFAAIIKELGQDIETHRVPISQEVVFSYRFSLDTDGQLFDPNIGYSAFQEKSLELLRTHTHVASTDIADFYARIYHHRLENALQSATSRQSHVSAIVRLLAGWNETETFGIPVGNAPSRMLAEITIADIDEAMLAKGVTFVRFNDDYRIFANSYSEAYRHLAFLADILYRNHGLTLQPQKTSILDNSAFYSRYVTSPEEREFDSLRERFDQLVTDLGLASWYEPIDYDDLTQDQRELIDSMNLVELFREEIRPEHEPDLGVVRFVLRRLGQLSDSALIDDVFLNLEVLHPAFPDVIDYLRNLRTLSEAERHDIGARVLNLLDDSIVSELDYHRMWALDLFTRSTDWNNEGQFFNLLGSARDNLSRRKLILAMGRASQRHWFQSQWRSLFSESPWPRRALLAAASCMSPDARKHWYKSVEGRLDPLEKAVMRWARQHPFG